MIRGSKHPTFNRNREHTMRIANLAGRLVIVTDGGAIDVEKASGGLFPPDPQAIYSRWTEFRDWADQTEHTSANAFDRASLGSPAPAPRQLFAIGLNYRAHALETGFPIPKDPEVFTKYVSSITGPITEVTLPKGGHTDWEVELVVVIGTEAHRVAEANAWSHVAGLSVGQDISERIGQFEGQPPQFSLAKSYPGFSVIGPWLVTPDEFDDPDDLELRCTVNGEQVQHSRTNDLIFSVPELIARLSAVLPLLPGDAIYTGTPPGVGLGRKPPRFLAEGDELVSSIEGIGELRQRFVA
jgi:2-keto-4-pentenoate hydratase/2-oxohepta-3-ene-1,7-dioic acid hydratase in catechol pathway